MHFGAMLHPFSSFDDLPDLAGRTPDGFQIYGRLPLFVHSTAARAQDPADKLEPFRRQVIDTR